jgi:hypothetical protein
MGLSYAEAFNLNGSYCVNVRAFGMMASLLHAMGLARRQHGGPPPSSLA